MNGEKKPTQCTCYSIGEKEGRLLVEVDLSGFESRTISTGMEKVNFSIPLKAVRG
jgi:hypothetical protein